MGDLEKIMEAMFEKLADRVVGLFKAYMVTSPAPVESGLDEGRILEKVGSRLRGAMGSIEKTALSVGKWITLLESRAPVRKRKGLRK